MIIIKVLPNDNKVHSDLTHMCIPPSAEVSARRVLHGRRTHFKCIYIIFVNMYDTIYIK